MTGASGEEGLDVMGRSEEKIAAAILDLGMPGMGGHKCLQEIRKSNPAAKVLIASGYLMNEQVRKGQRRPDTM
jgi:two-component system, cell cycle sensor histidine kinase and response regulator CckA